MGEPSHAGALWWRHLLKQRKCAISRLSLALVLSVVCTAVELDIYRFAGYLTKHGTDGMIVAYGFAVGSLRYSMSMTEDVKLK